MSDATFRPVPPSLPPLALRTFLVAPRPERRWTPPLPLRTPPLPHLPLLLPAQPSKPHLAPRPATPSIPRPLPPLHLRQPHPPLSLPLIPVIPSPPLIILLLTFVIISSVGRDEKRSTPLRLPRPPSQPPPPLPLASPDTPQAERRRIFPPFHPLLRIGLCLRRKTRSRNQGSAPSSAPCPRPCWDSHLRVWRNPPSSSQMDLRSRLISSSCLSCRTTIC